VVTAEVALLVENSLKEDLTEKVAGKARRDTSRQENFANLAREEDILIYSVGSRYGIISH